MKEFDEKQAIKVMRGALSPESSKLYVDDEILNIIDIIWDWYEDNGLLDIDTEADDEDVNTNALIKHVRKMLSKDPDSPINPDDVEALVMAELRYEQSLDCFED
ncbi:MULTISPECIES: hypothetical protein [Duncaniella]|jgi:hypothetical protein|uniref:Uncharacterized protein n=3 Tax=Duncaniella muris TaxID=2094150 RepID=A0A2V1ILI1_9BACT|nr:MULTISPECIES: hypothetical protein [Duncaniella]NBH92648.1 hypothetical protein [Muribaculaceae bacterium S4]NBI21105.1 hypothetical protein [Muribaculaceae bacterium Z1]ROS88381.1 hypothetical protein EEL34_08305 [Muribaculaceae bacterium Isolate-039 (Harlan)]ROS97827.1 hypothetical protein EEL37_05760 [Muribaculaceae bacterium Isolate-077 (Janvier)]ROS99316.1 hypothetical protein EEL40_03720 [Muribaculaceae bacterium Isolate-083 (Janvier)]ROT02161.1 hypothetical protein EEL41_02665 [Muri